MTAHFPSSPPCTPFHPFSFRFPGGWLRRYPHPRPRREQQHPYPHEYVVDGMLGISATARDLRADRQGGLHSRGIDESEGY
jgi:hypothetical protein